jgi:hypothetical protein
MAPAFGHQGILFGLSDLFEVAGLNPCYWLTEGWLTRDVGERQLSWFER